MKAGFESNKKERFYLIMEELSQSNMIYISTLLCGTCLKKLGLNSSTLFYDPQIRNYESNMDSAEPEEDLKYKDIFAEIDGELVSVCRSCILDVEPEFLELLDSMKSKLVELPKELSR
ncbi:hypothetical protein ACJJI5_06310 [Microbulbifer sp. EKSA008]|uniref:hypothetical protein n=1 Tax=Microbulbifer sp. EKSA008 TaxID=3243367 RepID=UPI004042E3EA